MLARPIAFVAIALFASGCLAPQEEETESASGAIEEPGKQKAAPAKRSFDLCKTGERLALDGGTTSVRFEQKIAPGTFAKLWIPDPSRTKVTVTIGSQKSASTAKDSSYVVAHDGRDGDMAVSFEMSVEPGPRDNGFAGKLDAAGCQSMQCTTKGETRMNGPEYGPLLWSEPEKIASACPTTAVEREAMAWRARDRGGDLEGYVSARWNWVERCTPAHGFVWGSVTPLVWEQACVRQ